MSVQKIFILCGLLLLMVCPSCRKYIQPCTYEVEPVVQFNFYYKNSSQQRGPAYQYFDRVYAIGANGDLVPRLNYYELPVNFNTDNMTVVFEKDNVQDTLQVTYQRTEIYGNSKDCGFYIEISNMEVAYSTFPKSNIEFTPGENLNILYIDL